MPPRRPRLYPPSSDPSPRRRRYGTVAGWPLDVLVWRSPPPPDADAVQLDPGVWIRLEIANPIARADETQITIMQEERADFSHKHE